MEYINTSSHQPPRAPLVQPPPNEKQKLIQVSGANFAPAQGSQEISQDDAWTVIKAYFKQHGLVSQQISSFNRFVNISL
jgi:DNA-directed RNA polymerase beta subunit